MDPVMFAGCGVGGGAAAHRADDVAGAAVGAEGPDVFSDFFKYEQLVVGVADAGCPSLFYRCFYFQFLPQMLLQQRLYFMRRRVGRRPLLLFESVAESAERYSPVRQLLPVLVAVSRIHR